MEAVGPDLEILPELPSVEIASTMKNKLAAHRARLARIRTAVASLPPLVMEKVFFFGGLWFISYGVWLAYKPLGFVAGGLIAFWLATLISGERHGR